ncbi:ATP-dependent nuclease [Nonomuraea cypriaca]|nr:AAA family ATPase [Nonomuraea cypriaca]
MSDVEAGTFGEFLTASSPEEPTLHVTFRAQIPDLSNPHRISTSIRAGAQGEGAAIDGNARELLRTTYLRPLRDAEAALGAGRNSRLAQILNQYPSMAGQELNDFIPDQVVPTTLVGILRRAEHDIENNLVIRQARDELNDSYLSKFALGGDRLESRIGVVSNASLQQILERLELAIAADGVRAEATRHGLGINNALFMAAELLLLGKKGLSPLLLIEEPEAHLHPQLQSRVMQLLVDHSSGVDAIQIIVTSHSTHLAASVPVERLAVVARGTVYPLSQGLTKLKPSDYAFLSRFLDATKANLFFARAVAIVEGDAEMILLPALAKAAGYSFNRDAVSVVNVGHTGLFRYARIFQRTSPPYLPVPVACIRDRDVAPAGTAEDLRRGLPAAENMTEADLNEHLKKLKEHDGQKVRTFVSDHWTFEYDLAAASWTLARIMHQAVSAATSCVTGWPSDERLGDIFRNAAQQVDAWHEAQEPLTRVAEMIYKPLRAKGSKVSKAIAAQHAAHLLESPEVKLPEADLPIYLSQAFAYLCSEPQLPPHSPSWPCLATP